MPKPDLGEWLQKLRGFATPRNVVSVVAGILLLFAIVYLAAGGNYFATGEAEALDAVAASMGSAGPLHLEGEILIESEKKGRVAGTVVIDSSGTGDYEATHTYTEDGGSERLDVVKKGESVYVSEDGGPWEEARDPSDYDFDPDLLFAGASSARGLPEEPMSGVSCDCISFSAGGAFASCLVPGSKAGVSSGSTVKVWTDKTDGLVRHATLTARDLSSPSLGEFDCHFEVDLSRFGAQVQIESPI